MITAGLILLGVCLSLALFLLSRLSTIIVLLTGLLISREDVAESTAQHVSSALTILGYGVIVATILLTVGVNQ